jgi:hypothetical protein
MSVAADEPSLGYFSGRTLPAAGRSSAEWWKHHRSLLALGLGDDRRTAGTTGRLPSDLRRVARLAITLPRADSAGCGWLAAAAQSAAVVHGYARY